MSQHIHRLGFGIAAALLVGLGATFVACAEGGADTGVDLVDLADQLDAGGTDASKPDAAVVLPPDSCNGACKADEVCRDGTCLALNPDDDKDGHTRDVDCDDTNPDIHPGAKEACNGKDDDCNGKVDEGFDQDNDGYSTCVLGDGGVDASAGVADCDDTNSDIHPGVKEVCNGKDDDCNGKVDEIPGAVDGALTDSRWASTGTTSIEAEWAALTPDTKDSAGGLWWGSAYTFDAFDLQATFKVVQAGDLAADGLVFAWLQGAGIPAVGPKGSGYGVQGATGYAVVLDMYLNNEEDFAPAVSIVSTGKMTAVTGGGRKSVPGLADGKEHALNVSLAGGKVSVKVDGKPVFSNVTLPNYKPFEGHWGFSAATGGFSEWHGVKGITMSFPEGQGCVK